MNRFRIFLKLSGAKYFLISIYIGSLIIIMIERRTTNIFILMTISKFIISIIIAITGTVIAYLVLYIAVYYTKFGNEEKYLKLKREIDNEMHDRKL